MRKSIARATITLFLLTLVTPDSCLLSRSRASHPWRERDRLRPPQRRRLVVVASAC